jgi:hypothetical protein
MTYDPRKSLQDVTQDIVDIIMAACKLALLDDEPTTFWLGFALHIVMDSYSPAHVMRIPARTAPPPPLQAQPIEDTAELGVLSKMRDMVRHQQKHTVENIRGMVKNLAMHAHIKSPSVRRDMKRLASFFAWHQQEMQDINKIRTVFNKTKIILEAFPDPVPLKLPVDTLLITRYHYYPDQSAWFHKQNDFLISAKYAGYLEPCIKDCAVLLQLYHTALTMIQRDPSAKVEITYVFLRRVYKYITRVTYMIHPHPNS